MKVREYEESDFASIQRWLHKWNHEKITSEQLPETGFVVPGVAIGFVRMVEGNMAIFDSMVSNPYASQRLRHNALDDLVGHIMAHLKADGVTKVLAFTVDDGTLTRAKRHGFKQLRHTLLSKE